MNDWQEIAFRIYFCFLFFSESMHKLFYTYSTLHALFVLSWFTFYITIHKIRLYSSFKFHYFWGSIIPHSTWIDGLDLSCSSLLLISHLKIKNQTYYLYSLFSPTNGKWVKLYRFCTAPISVGVSMNMNLICWLVGEYEYEKSYLSWVVDRW